LFFAVILERSEGARIRPPQPPNPQQTILNIMPGSLTEDYEARRDQASATVAHANHRRSQWANVLLAIAAIGLIFFWGVIHHNQSFYPVTASIAAAIVVAIVKGHASHAAAVADRRLDFYTRALGRITGSEPQTGRTGESFSQPNHLYERDLNILGPDSLFGLLATTRTGLGQRALADFLLHPTNAPTARQRQQAVQELAPLTDLRERIGLLGRFGFEDLPADSFETWLDTPRSNFPRWPRPVLAALSATWFLILIAGLVLHWDSSLLLRNIAMVLGLQALLCGTLRTRVLAELDAVKGLAPETAILRDGVRILRQSAFTSPCLLELQREIAGEDRALAVLERYLNLAEQRLKTIPFVLCLLLSGGTHIALGLNNWKRTHTDAMRQWLNAWADFEALNAIATYAAEHIENTYPEILDSPTELSSRPDPESAEVKAAERVISELSSRPERSAVERPAAPTTALFTAKSLTHPLLPWNTAVPNDITLNADPQFLLISGSNMAGKSTLLRAIGVNAVLALAGAPVAADSLQMVALYLGASIVVGDSLAEGKSKFLAEVERLKALVEQARAHPAQTLFLIDEVLSGTNSLDRKAAAESVLRSLLAAGAIGAISTHDLTLAALADIPELHGVNVHMASPDENDPLGFDYILKPGMNQTTNAMAIVRMLGLG
jgi:hypothetical protein